MMHNTYTSSIISLRTSLSFNGYSYYSSERCPSSCCCCSCPIPLNSSRLIAPVNPSFLYGLRQSTLIQLPPSRRLILGSGDRWSPICNVGQHYCGEPCCVKQERVGRFVEKTCKEECCVKKRSVSVDEIRSRMGRRNYRCSALEDAEAMLSFLTEDSIEECLDVRGKKRGSVKEGEVAQKQNVVSEKSESRKENVGLKSEMKRVEVDRGRVQSTEEAHMRREEKKAFSRGDDRWSSRRESSSSYHSISDSGDFESDTEVHIKHGGFHKESTFKHEKGSRKAGGIVIREDTKQASKTHRNQQLQSSTHDDLTVGNSTEWDCRKKSEKKLTEESAEETKSNKVGVVRQSQVSHAHESNSMKASSSKDQANYQEGESSSGVSFHEQSSSHIKIDDRVSEYLKSSTKHEQLMQANRNEAESTSNTWKISNEEENVMLVAKSAHDAGCEYCKDCGGIMQQSKTQIDSQQRAQFSEPQDDASVSLVAQIQSESLLTEQENCFSSLQNSVMETSSVQNKSESRFGMQEKSSISCETSLKEDHKQHHQVIHMAAGEVNTDKKSEHYTETVDSHGMYAESTLSSQKQSETRMESLGEYSTSIVSRQEVKALQEESRDKVIKEIEYNKESQIHSTNVEINCQSVSEQRIYSDQTYLTSKVEKHNQIYETDVQSVLRTEKKGHILEAGFTENSSGDTTVTQPSMTLVSQTQFDKTSEGVVKTDLQISVVSPLCQSVEERSPYHEPSIISVSNDHGSVTEIGTTAAYVQPQARPGSSPVEVCSSESKSFKEPSPEDTLDAAKHMGSMQIIGEFVEKMSHEVSTSDTKIGEQLSQNHSRHPHEKYMLKGSRQSGSEKIGLKKQDSRGLSEGSGTKGTSDEMLGMKSNLLQEPSEKESLEGLSSEDVAKRTEKSLWSILAGMFRIRWKSQSETQTSPLKSGGCSSSNELDSGETWFSKYDSEEERGNRLQKQQTSLPQNSTTSLGRSASRTRKEGLGVLGLDYKIKDVGVGASSSSSALQTGLLLGVVSTAANTKWNITQQMQQSSPSLDLSIKPARRLRKSHTSAEIEGVGRNEGPVSSGGEQRGHSIDVRHTGVSASEITDVELKQRKLQRSNQVLQETFDKWEDAYRLESEQRKIDEFFMTEALLEATKAADSWEVPVGAVLVQNGKIIARGYNLVEELRDSTAHAEMICIREVSSVLRTWRLSETTLYVTLEPCPMCAGAILQARIGTLVWGAPNKLLGADGSWIRLFHDAEGEQRPEVADKPPAPVHPFHPKMKIRRGVLQSECAEIMQQFFQLRRKKKKMEKKKSEERGLPSRLPIPHPPSKLLHKLHDIFHIVFCL